MEKHKKTWYPGLYKKPFKTDELAPDCQSDTVGLLTAIQYITMSVDNIEEEFKLNRWRLQTGIPIFKLIKFSYEICSNQTAVSKLIYEVPAIWISTFAFITIENCLYILKTVLEALPELILKFGYWKLTAKMMGVTNEGMCKIWINEKIYMNSVMEGVQNEERMIESLVDILESLVVKDINGKKFVQGIRRVKYACVDIGQYLWSFAYENCVIVPVKFHNEENVLKANNKKKHKKAYSYDTPKMQYERLDGSFDNMQYDRLSKNNKNEKSKQIEIKLLFQKFELKQIRSKNKNVNYVKTHVSDMKFIGRPIVHHNVHSQSVKSLYHKKISEIKSSECSTANQKENTLCTSIDHFSEPSKFLLTRKTHQRSQREGGIRKQIQQRIQINRDIDRIQKLQTIGTVKSIGEFIDSQKELDENEENGNRLLILHRMGRKILGSRFMIQSKGNLQSDD